MRAEGDRLKVSAPRGALAPELRDELARRKGELLEFLRGAEAAQRPPLPPIGRVSRSGPVPLSFAQRRLWLIHQLEPGSAAYNVPGVLRLRGPLDVPALVGALRGIVARHEVLRTTFPAAGGVPVQRIHPPSLFPVSLVDLSVLPAPDTEAGRLAGDDARRPFDLEQGPLLRVALLRLAEDDHAVLLTLHHIVSDGWSVSVFFRELTLLYEAGVRGVLSPLEPLALQYADFAAWQQSWLQGEVLEDQVSWWRRRLAGASPRIDLPPDRQSLGRTSGGAQIDLPLEPPLAAALAGLARSRGASLFMLYLAACQALLFRWSGQSDLSLGSPFAGRNRPEIEGLIGFFVNTLVLRATVDGEGSFLALLEQARETVLAAHARQDLPLERLVEELQPERSLDGSPLFQVLFTVHEITSVASEVAGLRLEPFPAGLPPAKLDLTLSVTLEDGAAVLSATWRPELYSALTLRRLLEHFRALLAAVAADPEARVAELPMLSAAELHQVAREWNDTGRAYPRDLPLHELFARQAALHPERAAVLFRGEEIPYGELDARANRLAHHLRALEVGPEDRVAFCLERTPETLVALLAILKAGGAYVPLDPDLPAERLSLLLADCRARVLLTDEASAGALPALPVGMRRVLLDSEAEAVARRPSTAPPCEVDGDHLAYVMYTSGSTGRPKGVAVLHRGVSRLVLAGGFARFGPGEVFLQLAPLSFDASTLEIWGALLHGACLVLPPERLLAPSELGEVLGAHGVTTLWLTAGLFHQMVEENVEGLEPVRQLLAGGDVLSPPHVRHVLASLPGCRVIDGYGPTEGTTFTCCQPLDDPRDVGDSIPVGRPIGTTRAYVLDRGLRPVPAGVAGELLAGGDGLARGYLDRPDLTAERFVPDPVSGEPGERLYRTGDLVRLRPDGAVDFLGRLDNQVKLRGFRVEPGEIETVLGGHPGVRECAVVVREDQGERRLAAFVVPREEDARGLPAALREHLRSRLPAYMVPPEWTLLDALPLNANGKVDRRALARIASVAEEEAAGEAPRTPAEELVAAVWAEVLGRQSIGRDDGFFDLGGHSLLAMQMVARLRQVSGVDLPLRLVFEHPSVAGLAAALEAARAPGSPAPPLRPVPRTGDLPLSFAQQRLWLIDRLEPGNAAYNIPLAVRLSGSVTAEHLERIFAEVVRRHEALRTTFAEGSDGPVQVVAPKLRPELPVVDLSALGAAAREAAALALAAEEARRPFDLRRGPLLRLALARLGAEDHLLLATFHHIVADGWSMGVLLQEVAALSAAFSRGEPSPLPELPVQYADFAVWQRGWLQGEALEAQLAAWRERLAGAPQTLDLPTDRPRPTRQSFRGAARPAALPPSLARSLRELCRRETATPFMALLAAWAALLGRHAHQEDVLVGTPVAGRHQPETEGLIGFFVNTLVLRTDLSGSPGFGELLRRVRRVSLDAFAHQDLPFERLVEELVPGRDLSRPPLFQVMLALQTAPVGDLEIQGLSFSPVAVESGLAKFELTLSLAEEEEGLAGELEHNVDLFDGTTAERLLARFQALLEDALADPGRPLDDLPLLLPVERHQVATEWNDTQAGPLGETPVHELVAAVARETPEAPAVTALDGSLTYAELAQRASQLARHLRRLGVGPETRVAVALEHSPERVISLLAVLSAGGAYVSLDPADAPERRAGILEDCGALLLLDSGGIADALEQSSGLSGEWFAGGAGLDHLAYVIYTSGSTGQPKGVEIPHRGLLSLVRWHLATYPTGPGARVAQVSNPGFDASVWDLWPNLAAGAEALIPPVELRTDPARLARWMIERGVTISFLPTALAELVLAEPWPAAAPLRHLLVGGDRLIQGPPRGLGFSVVNHYGPTEGSVVSTAGRVEPEAPAPSIGRPILNVRAHVAGPDGRLVPAGQGGELWIGGLGLARGYLGRPDLTAERFVPDPFGAEPGARLYRTGDQVRRLSDGRFEFLGRIDHQVKIRGVRIELGEIEAALAAHPAVREAVVLVRERAPGDRRLVAYVVAAEALDFRAFLRRRLPEAMIPGDFVLLEELPLTPNGKIDRARFPEPAGEGAPSAGTAPRTPAEELLAGLWAEVLGRPSVGTNEDFFALGGHSLLATRLLSRVRAATGAEIALRDLFEAPNVAGLAAAVERARGAGRFQAPPLERVEREGPLPLSFAQQRLWFLDRLTPGSAAYNVPLALRLEGELDVPALRNVFAGIAHRHEILRTTFGERDGEPVQVIHAPAVPPLPVIDLGSLAEGVRDREARELIRAETLHPFDLARGPLFRGALVRLAGTDHLLLATFHHIVSDGWSVGVVVRELEALYAGSPLPELPVQYGDFAVWQRGWLRGEVLEAEIAFWRERLAGAPALLDLPTERPRPPVQSERGASAPLDLPPSLAGRLEALGRAEGATLFMVVLAAFQTLLARWSGREDVSVGTPVAGRERLEVERLIGFFVNTLVQRADLSGDPPWRELLAQVRRGVLDAHAHQDVPFEKLVEELAPERSLGHAPLFQVMLNLQTAQGGSPDLPGLRSHLLDPEGTPAKLDLNLALARTEEGLGGGIEYAADLFDATTIQRLIGQLALLLEEVAADPGRRLSDLPLLAESERHQLLREWNDTGARSGEACLHELFERQASRTPDAVALIAGTERLLYRELDEGAERLAERLRALSVGPEARVAVHLRRSPEMVVALLAVLKAGGAYVPIDPAYPPARVEAILEDARPVAVLTEEGLRAERPAPGLPARGVTPDHLAYVIFTSGSTGRPKGVAITHRSAAVLLAWARDIFPPEDLDRVLFATSICFDLSVFELFLPLSRGGAVVLAENALALPDLPAANEVTLVNTVPSALAELVASRGLPPSVRTVNLAGEALRGSLVRRIYESSTVRRVLNLYGPSEDTTYSTWAAMERGSSREPAIGRPVAGTQAWLVDRQGQPVPAGAAGELMLSGAGLARGYLGRPDLTAERFLPNPFGERSGDRLYRTGDLARYRTDGSLEYLGRLDHQVKVRGFRIELGEIEAVLGSLPGVREAVVLAREERLVAWAAGASLSAAGLRNALAQRLPGYMVPSAIVVLDALPLTPNGKVDRKALPVPGCEAEGTRPTAAPRTLLEELLAGLWAEILDRGAVGREEDFFALGGHSLLATRLLSRLRSAAGVEVSLRELFEAPTVAGLAAVVERVRSAGRPVPPPLVPVERSGPLPLSFAQQRLWFLDRLSPASAAYNIPLGLVLEGVLEVPALASTLSRIGGRHETLRTAFGEVDGAPVQVIHPPGVSALPLIDLEGLSETIREDEARRLTREEMLRPFDLAQGPLFRTTLVRLERAEHLFLAVFHHIVSDGWSLGVVVQELEALWSDAPLPELPVQYGDFAVWQRSWLQGEVLDAEIAFWRERLAGAPALLDLPTDRPRPAVQSERGAAALVELPASLADRLEALGLSEGATLFMVLLATFQTLLARWSGREDVSVGTPVAGRGRLEVEGLIGFFVNTLVQRTDLSGDPSWRELLARVRHGVLDAHAHQDVPFEKLVEELAPERSLGHAPLFQVMLNLQTAPAGSPELPGLRTRVLDPEEAPAKFDLSLALARTGEGLSGLLEYTADLFDRTTIQRLLGQLGRLLEEVMADPGRRLSELPLLAESERHQLLVEWNDTGAGSGEACLHELFERQAARTPDAVALIAGTERLLYRELDERAERLAGRLCALGVGPESRVAVHLRRSPEMVVALLAVLKAGGAYVPIDPAYPPARVEAILEDARPVAVLTEEGLRAELPAPGLLARKVGPDHLAYVIFTSGSTGRPKGVAITHRSAAVLLSWAREVFPLEDLDRVLFATSICFDLSVFELFLPLSCGGAVVLAENALALPDLPAAGEVTLVNTVPSALAELVAFHSLPPSVRTINLAGEALRGSLVRRIHEIPTVCRVLNLYGPSEDTTYSTWAVMERKGSREPAIGRPVAGTQAWLVDRHCQPVPPGAAGELMLSGAGLARGYLGRPDLTAERFLPNPFAERPGDRLYRTGDLARYRADGSLEYLGRLDHQVKVRGFRIELGEIEAALGNLPGVREAVVLAREERLVAWVGGVSLSAVDLRSSLAERLPGYMVPSAIVVLDALPLTPNGKVDRKALPAPEAAAAARPSLPPRDALELELVRIWGEVLRQPVGIADSFFDLGGHSLLAVQLLSRIEARFGRRLPLAGLFAGPTVERQAEQLRSDGEGETFRALVPLETRGEEPPFFCVHAVGGGVSAYLELARRLGRPFYGLQAPPADGSVTVESLAALYLEEVRQRQPHGPYFLGGWSMGATVAFEMARRLRSEGEEVALLALLEPSFARPSEEPSVPSPESLFDRFVQDLALQGQPELAQQAGEPLGRALFETFRANLQALQAWRPSPYDGPAHLFLAGSSADTRGWEEVIRGGLTVSRVPGDHYSFLHEPHLPHLVEQLRGMLAGPRFGTAGASAAPES